MQQMVVNINRLQGHLRTKIVMIVALNRVPFESCRNLKQMLISFYFIYLFMNKLLCLSFLKEMIQLL